MAGFLGALTSAADWLKETGVAGYDALGNTIDTVSNSEALQNVANSKIGQIAQAGGELVAESPIGQGVGALSELAAAPFVGTSAEQAAEAGMLSQTLATPQQSLLGQQPGQQSPAFANEFQAQKAVLGLDTQYNALNQSTKADLLKEADAKSSEDYKGMLGEAFEGLTVVSKIAGKGGGGRLLSAPGKASGATAGPGAKIGNQYQQGALGPQFGNIQVGRI